MSNRGLNTQVRWADCRLIATRLTAIGHKVDKNDVNFYLYKDIKSCGLLEGCKVGEESILKQVLELDGWEEMKEAWAKQPVVAEADESEEEQEVQTLTTKYNNKVPVTKPAEQLKLAMWFVARYPSPDKALKAVQAAVAAAKMMEVED